MKGNLINRLYYVYDVNPPDGTPEFIHIARRHDDFIGCSQVIGVFRYIKEARAFAYEQAAKLRCSENLEIALERSSPRK